MSVNLHDASTGELPLVDVLVRFEQPPMEPPPDMTWIRLARFHFNDGQPAKGARHRKVSR